LIKAIGNDAINLFMRFSLMKRISVWHSSLFRIPPRMEKALGLWVDRIGGGRDRRTRPTQLRVLGLYAAVAVDRGTGHYLSPATGELQVPEGAAILVFPDMPHQYWPAGHWHSRYIVWTGPEADRLAAAGMLARSPIILPGAAAVVSAIHARMTPLLAREGLAAMVERKLLLLELLLELHRHQQVDAVQQHPDRAILRAMAWMQEQYPRPKLTIADCAAAAGLSTSHFRRRFAAQTGRSPKDFLTAVRIAQAKMLLSQGQPIKEVAAAVGYANLFHFMRQFRRITGQTAGQFRN